MRDELQELICVCGWCQKEFVPNNSPGTRQRRKFCGADCRKKMHNEMRNSSAAERNCAVCQKAWRGHKENSYACSLECAKERQRTDKTHKVLIWTCGTCKTLCTRVRAVRTKHELGVPKQNCLLCERRGTTQKRSPRGANIGKARTQAAVIEKDTLRQAVKCKTCRHGRLCPDSDIGWRCASNASVCKPLHLATLYERGRG